jgi:hypothetical protein
VSLLPRDDDATVAFAFSVRSVFNPYFHPYFAFVGASPSGRCRSGQGTSEAQRNCFGNTNGTDWTDEKTDRALRGDGAVRMASGDFFGWQLK